MNSPVVSLQYLHLQVKQHKVCALHNLRSMFLGLVCSCICQWIRMYTARPTEHTPYTGRLLHAWLDLESFLLFG